MYSGMHSRVNGLSHTGQWSLSQVISDSGYSNSSTSLGTAREDGIESTSGSLAGVHHTPVILPNQQFPFAGYTGPDSGVQDSPGLIYNVPALCTQAVVNWSFGENMSTKFTAAFVATGALSAVVGAPDQSSEAAPQVRTSPCGTHVKLDDTDLMYVTTAQLTLTAGTGSASNSDTNCSTVGFPGTLNWGLSIVQQNWAATGLGNLPTLRQDYIIALPGFNDDGVFREWVLRYGKYMGFSNLAFDTSSNTPVQRTLNFAMQANKPANHEANPAIYTPSQVIGTDSPWWGNE